ncbi:Rieske (2Fe-2S) protein [Pelomonas sp. KK5]|uniref:Rieske (2Fe-2S) protein n=1 Tax=Pelomonas sp. KK5 TaxID=1855730 RepID=UPI00097C22AA|nr:Rieske (2Fe-2S) protein [Pelomonas sp. KK5]
MQTTAWHPVVPSHFLREAENIVAGFIQGQEVALWRSQAGEVQAWDNRCPHRGTRFTLGRIIDDRLSCAYHGWEFAPSGKCMAIPAHPELPAPKNVGAKTFPVVERDGMVWVAKEDGQSWAGLPDSAGLSFCRSLGLRANVEVTAAVLAAKGLERTGAYAWQGRIADCAVQVLLNEAHPDLTFAHVWLADESESARVAASLQLLRRDVEGANRNGDTQ